MESVRIDKWLWAARMFKTRSLATKSCVAGHVQVNAEVSKASLKVKIGDTVEVLTPARLRILEIVALGDKRGPASVAQGLYMDHTPPEPPKEEPAVFRERGTGRPSKRQRRSLQKLRGR
jgi:ribosome-associated heat shock protein Hsp15